MSSLSVIQNSVTSRVQLPEWVSAQLLKPNQPSFTFRSSTNQMPLTSEALHRLVSLLEDHAEFIMSLINCIEENMGDHSKPIIADINLKGGAINYVLYGGDHDYSDLDIEFILDKQRVNEKTGLQNLEACILKVLKSKNITDARHKPINDDSNQFLYLNIKTPSKPIDCIFNIKRSHGCTHSYNASTITILDIIKYLATRNGKLEEIPIEIWKKTYLSTVDGFTLSETRDDRLNKRSRANNPEGCYDGFRAHISLATQGVVPWSLDDENGFIKNLRSLYSKDNYRRLEVRLITYLESHFVGDKRAWILFLLNYEDIIRRSRILTPDEMQIIQRTIAIMLSHYLGDSRKPFEHPQAVVDFLNNCRIFLYIKGLSYSHFKNTSTNPLKKNQAIYVLNSSSSLESVTLQRLSFGPLTKKHLLIAEIQPHECSNFTSTVCPKIQQTPFYKELDALFSVTSNSSKQAAAPKETTPSDPKKFEKLDKYVIDFKKSKLGPVNFADYPNGGLIQLLGEFSGINIDRQKAIGPIVRSVFDDLIVHKKIMLAHTLYIKALKIISVQHLGTDSDPNGEGIIKLLLPNLMTSADVKKPVLMALELYSALIGTTRNSVVDITKIIKTSFSQLELILIDLESKIPEPEQSEVVDQIVALLLSLSQKLEKSTQIDFRTRWIKALATPMLFPMLTSNLQTRFPTKTNTAINPEQKNIVISVIEISCSTSDNESLERFRDVIVKFAYLSENAKPAFGKAFISAMSTLHYLQVQDLILKFSFPLFLLFVTGFIAKTTEKSIEGNLFLIKCLERVQEMDDSLDVTQETIRKLFPISARELFPDFGNKCEEILNKTKSKHDTIKAELTPDIKNMNTSFESAQINENVIHQKALSASISASLPSSSSGSPSQKKAASAQSSSNTSQAPKQLLTHLMHASAVNENWTEVIAYFKELEPYHPVFDEPLYRLLYHAALNSKDWKSALDFTLKFYSGMNSQTSSQSRKTIEKLELIINYLQKQSLQSSSIQTEKKAHRSQQLTKYLKDPVENIKSSSMGFILLLNEIQNIDDELDKDEQEILGCCVNTVTADLLLKNELLFAYMLFEAAISKIPAAYLFKSILPDKQPVAELLLFALYESDSNKKDYFDLAISVLAALLVNEEEDVERIFAVAMQLHMNQLSRPLDASGDVYSPLDGYHQQLLAFEKKIFPLLNEDEIRWRPVLERLIAYHPPLLMDSIFLQKNNVIALRHYEALIEYSETMSAANEDDVTRLREIIVVYGNFLILESLMKTFFATKQETDLIKAFDVIKKLNRIPHSIPKKSTVFTQIWIRCYLQFSSLLSFLKESKSSVSAACRLYPSLIVDEFSKSDWKEKKEVLPKETKYSLKQEIQQAIELGRDHPDEKALTLNSALEKLLVQFDSSASSSSASSSTSSSKNVEAITLKFHSKFLDNACERFYKGLDAVNEARAIKVENSIEKQNLCKKAISILCAVLSEFEIFRQKNEGKTVTTSQVEQQNSVNAILSTGYGTLSIAYEELKIEDAVSYQKGVDFFKKLCNSNSHRGEVLIGLAVCYKGLGQWSAVVNTMEQIGMRALMKMPYHFVLLGTAAYKIADFDKALLYFEKAAKYYKNTNPEKYADIQRRIKAINAAQAMPKKVTLEHAMASCSLDG